MYDCEEMRFIVSSCFCFLAFAFLLNLLSFSFVSAESVSVEELHSSADNSLQLAEEESVALSSVPDNIQNLVSDKSEDKLYLMSDLEEEAEIFTLRTENSETGEGTLTVHSVPVKYVDQAGEYQFIDTSMKALKSAERVESGFAYRNSANSFTLEFGNTASKGININNAFTFEANSHTAGSGIGQIQTEKGYGKIVYPHVFASGTRVEYINTESGLKENIILDRYAGQNRFDFTFRSDTHIPVLTENGTNILVTDKNDPEKVEYRFLSLYAYDSYDPETEPKQQNSDFRHMNEDLYYELTDNGGGVYTITVVVPEDYLTNPEVVYPVTMDFSATVGSNNSNAQDTFVSAETPTTQANSALDYIRFGKANGYKNFGYHRFTSLPSLPAGANITSAYLRFTFRSGQNTPTASSGIEFWTLQVTDHQWYESSITWNNQPYGSAGPCTPFTYNGGYLDYVTVNMTDIVKSWYGGSPNYGIDFTYSNEDYNDYNSVVSSEGNASRAPVMTIYYSVAEDKSDTIGLVDGESYFIGNVFLDKYFSVYNNIDVNYTTVFGYQYHGGVSQQWKLVNCGINKYKLVAVGSPTGRVLDVTGEEIDIYKDNNASYQKFTITRQNTLLYGRSGQYYIQYEGKYLTLSTDNSTITLQSTPETYYGRSLWTFEMVRKGDADLFNFSEFQALYSIDRENYQNNMSSMGYRPYYFVDTSRNTAFNYLKNDSIWFHGGHGAPGIVHFNDGDILATQIDALPSNELAGLRCFITLGCSSGAPDKYGKNIIDSVYKKGAQFALGFTHTQYTPFAEMWLIRFFEHSSAENDIKSSLRYADLIANVPEWGTDMKYYKGDDEQNLSR